MPITAQQYERLKAKLAESASELSPDVLAHAQAAIEEFDTGFMGKSAQQIEVPDYDAAKVEAIKAKLTPDLPIQPQVLALQPATGHEKGDEAAKDEWIRGDLDNPNGKVVVYDAPAATVRQKLMENPERFKALGYEQPLSPEDVTSIEAGDSIVQAYNDREWATVADAAVKAGKTPYRYSKAPWLKDGQGGDVLANLSTKVKSSALPALESATAFLMGHDDTATFGAAGAAHEAGLLGEAAPPLTPEEEKDNDYHPTLGKVPKGMMRKPSVEGATLVGGGGDEVVGGTSPTATAEEQRDQLREEHPALHLAGQVAGAVPGLAGGAVGLAGKGAGRVVGAVSGAAGEAVESGARGIKELVHWNPANSLWEWVTSASMNHASALSKATPTVIKGVGAGALAAGTNQAAHEAVKVGADLAGRGETDTTLAGAAGRTVDAAKMGAGGAAAGAAVGQAGRTYSNWVEKGKRYRGLPDQLNRLGLEPQFGRGYVAPKAIEEARIEAAKRPLGGVDPVDILAEGVRDKVGHAVDPKKAAAVARKEAMRADVADRNATAREGVAARNAEAKETVAQRNDAARRAAAARHAEAKETVAGRNAAAREAAAARHAEAKQAVATRNEAATREAAEAKAAARASKKPAPMHEAQALQGRAMLRPPQALQGRAMLQRPPARKPTPPAHAPAVKKLAERPPPRERPRVERPPPRERVATERATTERAPRPERLAPEAPPIDVYRKTIQLARQKPGQSEDVELMHRLATAAGAQDTLKAARTLGSLNQLEALISQDGIKGNRSILSPSLWFDEANMRIAYPATRAAGRSAGLAGGKTAKLAQLAGDDGEERSRKRDEANAPAYKAKVEAAKKKEEAKTPSRPGKPRRHLRKRSREE